MTELRLIGDHLEMDGQRVATLEPNIRSGCSLRHRLKEALDKANNENKAESNKLGSGRR